MPRHIAQDYSKKHAHFVLETRLMYEKRFRDAFLDNLCNAVQRLDQPMAKSLEGNRQQMFQRKVATFNYNQYGMFRLPMHKIGHVDRFHCVRGNIGTRDWVPWANVSAWTFDSLTKKGNILAHRVHWRGYGTDTSLKQGGWQFRWNKIYERNTLQYNRV